jgi:hypothetical protein
MARIIAVNFSSREEADRFTADQNRLSEFFSTLAELERTGEARDETLGDNQPSARELREKLGDFKWITTEDNLRAALQTRDGRTVLLSPSHQKVIDHNPWDYLLH